jgi:uncharacterized protein HemX
MPVDSAALLGSGVISAAIAGSGGWYAAHQSRKANDKKVDAEAYDRARSIDKEVNDRLRTEIQRLQEELNQTRQELEGEERITRALQSRLGRMERRLERCIYLLDQAGIAVPEPETTPVEDGVA